MANEMFQARLDEDFADEIHEFREEKHMNKSEAVRHLLRAGLEAEQGENAAQIQEIRTDIQELRDEMDTEDDLTIAGDSTTAHNIVGTDIALYLALLMLNLMILAAVLL